MPVVDTTNPFSNNEQITSTKLNNIMDNSFFVSGAVVPGQGLQVTAGGQMQIGDGDVTPGKLSNSDFGDFTVSSGVATIDNNAITTAKIADANVTPAKLSNSDFGAFTVASGIATLDDNSVTTSKITDANITAPKLSGEQSGSAPIYGTRAWVNFNAQSTANIGGTYTRTASTTVTVDTSSDHGLIVGNAVYLDFTVGTGTAPFDGLYVVASIVDSNTFTVVSSIATTSTGTVSLLRKTIRGSGNVANVSAAYSGATVASPPASDQSAGNGFYVVNFMVAMPDSNAAISGVCNQSGDLDASSGNDLVGGFTPNEKCAFITTISVGSSPVGCLHTSVQVIR
jgi:hypothetical protein